MPASANVAVVIPTLRRPKLVRRALASVLAQTHRTLDVIVVVDGPDEETMAALAAVADPRLRVIVNERSLGAAAARNLGVAHTDAEWIAFLDDDDSWLPHKLERQVALAQLTGTALISCLSEVVTPNGIYVWPETIYDNRVPLDEYLFGRPGTFMGAAFIQTSSYFMPRVLFEASPFRADTAHDDWDFLLRLTKQLKLRIETVPEVLVRHYAEEERPSLTRAEGWRQSLAWLDQTRALLTPVGYSGICLGVVGSRAANAHAYGAFFPLLARAIRHGSPHPWQLMAYIAFWVLPQTLRRRLRAAFRGQGLG